MQSFIRSTDVFQFRYFFYVCIPERWFGCNVSVFEILNLYVTILTMGAMHISNGPSHPLITCSEYFKFNYNSLSISLPNIIACLLLVYLSTWHSHIMVFVTLNSGRQKFTLTFWLVVRFPAFIFHYFTTYFSFLIFDVILLTTIM